MTSSESKIISLKAAINERQGLLNKVDRNLWQFGVTARRSTERSALKAQIRDLEAELHEELQKLT